MVGEVDGTEVGATEDVVMDIRVNPRHEAVAVTHVLHHLVTAPAEEHGVVMEIDKALVGVLGHRVDLA